MYAIRCRNILTPGEIIDGYVVIGAGSILDVARGDPGEDLPVLDHSESYLMPGIVDPHVHINEPGRTEWEGFDTATRAALAGGVTSLFEMPLNSSPVTTSLEAYLLKKASAEGRIHMNCGFWGGVVPGNEDEIPRMIEAGVRVFKAFLIDSGISEFPPVTAADLEKIMPLLAAHGLPLMVHCEMESPVEAKWTDRGSYRQYLASRPRRWENEAVQMMISLCEKFRGPVHIVHLSSADAIGMIADAKERQLPVTAETAPHYLYFSAEQIPDQKTVFKCAPPIREGDNNRRLLDALRQGIIDFVATDHSPCPPSLRLMETGDLLNAWGGIASLQFSLPVLLSVMRQNGLSLNRLSEWLCEKPSLLPGLRDRGKIQKGYKADLLVFNPEEKLVVREEMIWHRHKETPYLGEELWGKVEAVYLEGEAVFQHGNFLHLNKGRIL